MSPLMSHNETLASVLACICRLIRGGGRKRTRPDVRRVAYIDEPQIPILTLENMKREWQNDRGESY